MELIAFLHAYLGPWGDTINALFELAGGFFILNNCRQLYHDKLVKGVSVLSTIFFTSWGIWNLYYYPSLNQWASFAGGVLITVGNVLWVSLMIYYVRHPGGRAATEPLAQPV